MSIPKDSNATRLRATSALLAMIAILAVLTLTRCSSEVTPPTESGLARIVLPDGFSISYYHEAVPGARSLAWGSRGTLFVGTRSGTVYALVDTTGNVAADEIHVIASGLDQPNGIAFAQGSLFVAESERILRFANIEDHLQDPPIGETIRGDLPVGPGGNHDWRYLRTGPDGKLYVSIGAPCNVCDESDPRFASISRLDPDGTHFEVFVHGVRNSVGFDWHPVTAEFWFTDNGRDGLGDDLPPDELNRVSKPGQHFGFPYCHGGTILDPTFGSGHDCADYVAPVQNLGAHVASLGFRFYTRTQFPLDYQTSVFIAEHGSWDRLEKVGYGVSRARIDGNTVTSYETFATGWLGEDGQAWGRPVDILTHPDGSLLVSDDRAGAVYRIRYGKPGSE